MAEFPEFELVIGGAAGDSTEHSYPNILSTEHQSEWNTSPTVIALAQTGIIIMHATTKKSVYRFIALSLYSTTSKYGKLLLIENFSNNGTHPSDTWCPL